MVAVLNGETRGKERRSKDGKSRPELTCGDVLKTKASGPVNEYSNKYPVCPSRLDVSISLVESTEIAICIDGALPRRRMPGSAAMDEPTWETVVVDSSQIEAFQTAFHLDKQIDFASVSQPTVLPAVSFFSIIQLSRWHHAADLSSLDNSIRRALIVCTRDRYDLQGHAR